MSTETTIEEKIITSLLTNKFDWLYKYSLDGKERYEELLLETSFNFVNISKTANPNGNAKGTNIYTLIVHNKNYYPITKIVYNEKTVSIPSYKEITEIEKNDERIKLIFEKVISEINIFEEDELVGKKIEEKLEKLNS
jgi:hypothetical protein